MKKPNKYDNVNLVRVTKEENEIVSSDKVVRDINRLHSDMYENMKDVLQKAKRIGELLTMQKEILGHGHFKEWIENNLPFGERQAQKYMKVYNGRETLENLNANSEFAKLDDITKALSNPESFLKTSDKSEPVKLTKQDKINKLEREIESLEKRLIARKAELKELKGNKKR